MLQQTPTFNPFMGKFIAFTLIAKWTGQYDEIYIMTRTAFRATYRDGMIEMINKRLIHTLLKLAEAIIASILLCFQFVSNLLNGQHAFNAFQARAARLMLNFISYAIRIRTLLSVLSHSLFDRVLIDLIVPMVLCVCLFTMGLIVLPIPCPNRFQVMFTILLPLLKESFTMSKVMLLLNGLYFFPMGLTVSPLACTYFFPMGFSIRCYLRKPLFSMLLITLLTFFNTPSIIGFAGYESAYLARSTQSISCLIEELRGSGKPLFTFTSALFLWKGRGIIHGLNSPLLSHLSFSVARMVGVPLLSQWLITPLLGNMSIVPFFIAACKAEVGV